MIRQGDAVGHLMPGESIVWSGTPRGGIRFQSSDVLAILFSIAWTGFVIFWEVSVVRSGAPGFSALFGVPFLVIGGYMTVGRFFLDAYRRSRTRYFLTDCRALILTEWPTRRVHSVNLATLPVIALTKHTDGTGTLMFGAREHASRSALQSPRFEWIDEAQTVYHLALAAQFDTDDEAAQLTP
ncbi:MAG TPA: hypothetical protein VHB79_02940 [Polyangiaceae bacterium]|nr:hypothetical protein [Polyangiaceae bacterium]